MLKLCPVEPYSSLSLLMPRKKWSAKTEITPDLLRLREKRKWQIALRRYVLEKNPSLHYAPYFGIDVWGFRQWISNQFTGNMSWDNFGQSWQFEHILPVACFDFQEEADQRLCWNFLNIRVEPLNSELEKPTWFSLAASRAYFDYLYQKTGNQVCKKMIDKINTLESAPSSLPEKQLGFLQQNAEYLSLLENFTSVEFELLNSGRNRNEVLKEINFLKKFQAR
jgi:hypothetical protein